MQSGQRGDRISDFFADVIDVSPSQKFSSAGSVRWPQPLDAIFFFSASTRGLRRMSEQIIFTEREIGYSWVFLRMKIRVYLHCTLQKPRRNIVLVIQSCADGRRDWNLSISTLFKMTQHQFYYFPTNCRQNILSLPNRKIIVLHPKRTENWYMPTTMISENPDEMTISWVTKDDTGHSLVEYGPQTLHLVAKGSSTLFVDGGAERRTMYMHRVTLKKLSAGQIYSKSRVIW